MFEVHVKGAPEKVKELCSLTSMPENLHSTLLNYT